MRSARPTRVSIKLSALHPRFEEAKRARVFSELLPTRARARANLAAERGVGITLDAEESERLELTLDLLRSAFERIPDRSRRSGVPEARARRSASGWRRPAARRITVRLVKGAYWDGEIKRAQQLGMPDYPVFTRKAATDVSYVACASDAALGAESIYPAFATHNCRTVATILELRRRIRVPEALRHGRRALRRAARRAPAVSPCRIYAPVGGFTDLLPYLVRRLLENGANTSFVHQIADPDVPVEALVADPVASLPEPYEPDPRIPLPRDLYPDRLNSLGLGSWPINKSFEELDSANARRPRAEPFTAVEDTSPQELDFSIARAADAFESWSRAPAAERAALLERAADALEARMVELVSLIVREGGRTYNDAVAEVREAADFCRYYAAAGEKEFRATVASPRARPASATSCACTAAASSPASARGTSRSPSSPARSPPRSPPATP